MLWLKAFHIVSMVTWFAGLFYLPRLFVYHAEANDKISHDRFVIMERKLFVIMTIGAGLTVLFGMWLLLKLAAAPSYLGQGWLHAKLTVVGLLLVYHGFCWRLIRNFGDGNNSHSHRWYRWFNEIPALALVIIIVLVVVRPF